MKLMISGVTFSAAIVRSPSFSRSSSSTTTRMRPARISSIASGTEMNDIASWCHNETVKPLIVLLMAAAVMPDLKQLQQMTARFAPVKIKYDQSKLSSGDKKALAKLIDAAKILNNIFMDQLWSGNKDLYAQLQKDTSPLGKARLHYFWLNKGPWSDLDAHTAFMPGVPERKPLGANFYPADMTREQFE